MADENINPLNDAPETDQQALVRDNETEAAAAQADEQHEQTESQVGPTSPEAEAARDEAHEAADREREAGHEQAEATTEARREQMAVEVDHQNEQRTTGLAALDEAEERAKAEGTTPEAVLNEQAEEGDTDAQQAIALEQGESAGPKADAMVDAPHGEPDYSNKPEAGTMEANQEANATHSAQVPGTETSISELAESYDLMRGAALGMVRANDASLAVFQAFMGQYQVRTGEGLAVPDRRPDVETLNGEWWQERDQFVGRPRGVDGLVYRIPRSVSSVPSLSRVHFVDPDFEQQTVEARRISDDVAPIGNTPDMGAMQQVRPEASIGHAEDRGEYDGSRSTLGGFTGRAVRIPLTPVDGQEIPSSAMTEEEAKTEREEAEHGEDR